MSEVLVHHPLPASEPTVTRALVVQGNAADINTWSNIPYYLFKNAKPAGFLTHALDLTDPQYAKNRLLWRIGAAARLQRPFGYQMSEMCAERMWDRVPDELKGGEFLSHAQPFPSVAAMRGGASVSYFIDGTLKTNHTDIPDQYLISPKLKQQFYARERELYERSKFVIAMARRTARSVIEDYGIEASKVFVVRPGANIDDDAVERFFNTNSVPAWRSGESFNATNPAVLGFIGMDPIRKNLALLVAVAEILSRRGRPVKVRVVGGCTEELQKHPLVDFVGKIAKRTEIDRFTHVIGTFAMGCLLSVGEPLGISTLECIRLGVPVLGRDTGGIPDCIPDNAGILVRQQASAEEIADLIEPQLFDPTNYAALCSAARGESEKASWRATVARLQAVWQGRVASEAGTPAIREQRAISAEMTKA